MEEARGNCERGRDSENGFVGYTASQVDHLFALFNGIQNQENMDKLSDKSFHTSQVQWVRALGTSHYMTSNWSRRTNVYTLLLPIIISQPNGRQIMVKM